MKSPVSPVNTIQAMALRRHGVPLSSHKTSLGLDHLAALSWQIQPDGTAGCTPSYPASSNQTHRVCSEWVEGGVF